MKQSGFMQKRVRIDAGLKCAKVMEEELHLLSEEFESENFLIRASGAGEIVEILSTKLAPEDLTELISLLRETWKWTTLTRENKAAGFAKMVERL